MISDNNHVVNEISLSDVIYSIDENNNMPIAEAIQLAYEADSNDGLSDEELDKKINSFSLELESFNNPQIINSGLELDLRTIDEFYENIRKMPREKFTTLLVSIGKTHSNLGLDYDFSGMSENSKKATKKKLADKISHIKDKKSAKKIMTELQSKYNDMSCKQITCQNFISNESNDESNDETNDKTVDISSWTDDDN